MSFLLSGTQTDDFAIIKYNDDETYAVWNNLAGEPPSFTSRVRTGIESLSTAERIRDRMNRNRAHELELEEGSE